jgi:hypothetical protein
MGGGKRLRGQKLAAGEASREEDHGKEENVGHMLSLTHDWSHVRATLYICLCAKQRYYVLPPF